MKNQVSGFLATMLCAGVAHATPHGELDATFGENGRVWIGPRYDVTLRPAVAQQSIDGKLVVVGSTWTTPSQTWDFLVTRLNSDGSVDIGFGNGGTTLVDFDGRNDFPTSVAVLPDGKIVIAGYVGMTADTTGMALTRLNPDGSIDSTFGNGGRVTLAVGDTEEYIAKMVLLPDGRIVVAGGGDFDGDFDAVFARFNADGTLDTTFGTGRIPGTTVVDSGSQDQVFGMVVQADGKFVTCGHAGRLRYDPADGQLLAIRVNPDGSVDREFGTNGVSLIETGAPRGSGRGCVAMPDGKTILAGFAGARGHEDLLLARLETNGVLDTSFGIEGRSTIDLGGSESAQSIIRLEDGALAVTGWSGVLDSETLPANSWSNDIPVQYSDTLIARINPDSGLLDPDFGAEGVTLVDFGFSDSRAQACGRALMQQVDGKLLAVGEIVEPGDWWDTAQIALARVDPAGAGNAGIASFVDGHTEVSETAGRAVLVVRRTGGVAGDLSVDYTTVPNDAIAPGDFTAISGTLTWLSGDMAPKSITVTITDDNTFENFEGFKIVLTGPANHVGFGSRWVFIDDNEAPPPQVPLSPAPISNISGGGGAFGIAELLALTLVWIFATDRRRRRFADSDTLEDS